jgi:DNA-binding CsgD family transcriptional regulator
MKGGDRKTIDIPKDKLTKMLKDGCTLEEIAEHFGCSIYTIRSRMKKYGVEKYLVKNRKKRICVNKNELERLLNAGYSYGEICKRFGVTINTVKARMEEYGLVRTEEEKKRITRRAMKEAKERRRKKLVQHCKTCGGEVRRYKMPQHEIIERYGYPGQFAGETAGFCNTKSQDYKEV